MLILTFPHQQQEDEQAEARPAMPFRTGRVVLEAERRRKGLPPLQEEAAKPSRQPGDNDLHYESASPRIVRRTPI